MVLVKRKPLIYHSLPSLGAILQPIASSSDPSGSTPALGADTPEESKPAAKSKKSGKGAQAADEDDEQGPSGWIPPDGKDDEEQLERLLTVFKNEAAQNGLGAGTNGTGSGRRKSGKAAAPGGSTVVTLPGLTGLVNGDAKGHENQEYRLWDRECFFIQETGEIFVDYESYCARRAFLDQPLFQCEVSGKSGLTYFAAQASEIKEVRQLHTRFPAQLKKAVLSAVQFQIEGKLDSLADRVFERFVNRFFDGEKVFVDVQGDKYLARIIKTFPPRTLPTSTANSPLKPSAAVLPLHPFATDLSLDGDEVNARDDPMKYFYNVRLIEEGAQEGTVADYGSSSNGAEEDGEDTKWNGSVMEVQADKISRDRINFSRAMLKRFIRDCVHRDAAIYSPWVVKPSVAARYGIPTEMPDDVRVAIDAYRRGQMDKRKREREERLGIKPDDGSAAAAAEDESNAAQPKSKKRKSAAAAAAAAKEEAKEEVKVEEERKKKITKFPAEDLLVEWVPERDEAAGRVEIRPEPERTLPFGDSFETLLMAWSFLNVMGKPLHLSPFSLDDFEQSLYHSDSWSNPAPLMVEVHATLLNALVRDLQAGHEAVRPLKYEKKDDDDETDYWTGAKGATTETLRPVCLPLAESWKAKELSVRDNRKGWEGSLVGCLWERASMDTLPDYLHWVLHLTHEDKPAPTRPTWSTGPTTSSAVAGLVAAKPEKRYSSLHHTVKLQIITFLCELVAQTEVVREFLEESTAALTEVRKDQNEAKRELRRIQAEKDALEPKEQSAKDGDPDGDVSMSGAIGSRAPSVAFSHQNGTVNGTDADELEGSAAHPESDEDADDDDDMAGSASSPAPDDRAQTGAQRRKAMAAKAAAREEEEAERKRALQRERALEKEKKAESKHLAAEKKRLQDEEDALALKLRSLDHDFRSHLYTLRARPLGTDRFGNKIWWMDGLGSAPLVVDGAGSKPAIGTARIYIQGADDMELEWCRLATAFDGWPALTVEEVDERRSREEAGGKLRPGEWAMYDSVEQLRTFMAYLNPKGLRESQLLKSLRTWTPELEASIRRRRLLAGLDQPAEEDGRARRTRKVAGENDEGGYLGWKNKRAV